MWGQGAPVLSGRAPSLGTEQDSQRLGRARMPLDTEQNRPVRAALTASEAKGRAAAEPRALDSCLSSLATPLPPAVLVPPPGLAPGYGLTIQLTPISQA